MAFFAQIVQGQEAKPIDVFVTWLDDETAVLVLRSPAPPNRIVVGIARPGQSKEDEGHLYLIPGLKDVIRGQADLDAFRAALKAGNGVSGKYNIHSSPRDGPPFSFAQIDSRFVNYVHGETRQTSDLEVWDVKPYQSTQELRITFLGDLVFVRSSTASAPLSKTENAIVQLLTNLAIAEDKGTRPLSLGVGCANSGSNIEAVSRNSPNREVRKNLRKTFSGSIIASRHGEEDRYDVTNTGWVLNTLHLELSPPPPGSGFKVTFSGPNEEEITSSKKDLELPPCAAYQISIEPQQWYEEFPERVGFAYEETTTTLRVTVPTTSLRLWWIAGGLLLLVVAAFILHRVIKYIRREKPVSGDEWKRKIDKGKGRKLPNGRILSADETPVVKSRSWWKFWEGWGEPDQKDAKLPTENQSPDSTAPAATSAAATAPTATAPTATAPTATAPAATSTSVLTDLFRQYDKGINDQQKLFGFLREALEKSLQDLESSNDARNELDGLRRERDAIATSLRLWTDTLGDLGETPQKIAGKWQTLKQGVLNIKRLLPGADKNTEGAPDDPGLILKELYAAVQKLNDGLTKFQIAAVEIAETLHWTPAMNTDKSTSPGELTTQVQRLRELTDRVFQRFAQPLQVGQLPDFKNQSVAALKERFTELEETSNALAILSADVRVHRARIVSRGLANAGRAVGDIESENSLYSDLFPANTRIELKTLARQLLAAADSSEATLTKELAKQPKPINSEVPKRDIDRILIPFIQQLLSSDGHYQTVMHMLRLWQVTEVYCLESDDPLARELHVRSKGFRLQCEQTLSDFACLGVYFHSIRFLTDPEIQGLVFNEARAVPLIEYSPKLMEPLMRKLESDFAAARHKTVEDVESWGFECDLDPSLSLKTNLWLWRSLSKSSSGTSDVD